MPAATSIAVAGLALAAIGTGVQFVAGRKQARAGRAAAKEQERLAALEARRARRRTIREGRIQRGALLAQAVGTGAQGSGLASAPARIASQVGANLAFSGQSEAIGKNITKFGIKASKAASLGAIGAGIAGIGGAAFSGSEQFAEILG